MSDFFEILKFLITCDTPGLCEGVVGIENEPLLFVVLEVSLWVRSDLSVPSPCLELSCLELSLFLLSCPELCLGLELGGLEEKVSPQWESLGPTKLGGGEVQVDREARERRGTTSETVFWLTSSQEIFSAVSIKEMKSSSFLAVELLPDAVYK